jgi:hypothetical protein
MEPAAMGWPPFVAVLLAIYLGAAFGPPPPSARAVALSTAPGFLFAFWADWTDRHRIRVP